MTTRRVLAVPLFLLLALAGAPGLAPAEAPGQASTAPASPSAGPAVVASVNGEPVYLEDLKRLLEQMHSGASAAARSKPDLDRLMFRLVNDTLLAQEARAMGMDKEDPVPAQLHARREAYAVARLERQEVSSRAEPSDEEIRQAFAEEYRTITFRMVTAREREAAEKLRRRLQEGADFDAVAKESSVDPYGPRGGLVKDVTRLDMPPELADVAFALKPGDLEGPIATGMGWSVIRVESFAPADPARFDQLRASLRMLVKFRKAEVLRADLATRLRATHNVVVDDAAVAAVVPVRLPDGRLMPKVETPEAVLVRVGDRTVTAERLGQALGARWKGVANEAAALASRPIVLDRLVQAELMAAEALARGYGDTEEARRALHAAGTQILVPRYLNQVVGRDVHVTPEEMRAYYDANREHLHRPPRLHLRQVTVPTEAEAQRVAGLLKQGTDVGWLARQSSTDGYKDSGGDRGWVVAGQAGETFDKALFEAKPGEVIGPNVVPGGFSVVLVEAREEQGIYDYKEVSGNVRKAVTDQKVQQAIHELIQKLRSRSKIEIYEDRVASLRISAAPVEEKAPPHGVPSTPEP